MAQPLSDDPGVLITRMGTPRRVYVPAAVSVVCTLGQSVLQLVAGIGRGPWVIVWIGGIVAGIVGTAVWGWLFWNSRTIELRFGPETIERPGRFGWRVRWGEVEFVRLRSQGSWTHLAILEIPEVRARRPQHWYQRDFKVPAKTLLGGFPTADRKTVDAQCRDHGVATGYDFPAR